MSTSPQRHRPDRAASLAAWAWWAAATVAISVPVSLLILHGLDAVFGQRSTPISASAAGPSLGAEVLEALASPVLGAFGWAGAQADAGRWPLLIALVLGYGVAMSVLSPVLGLLARSLRERWGR